MDGLLYLLHRCRTAKVQRSHVESRCAGPIMRRCLEVSENATTSIFSTTAAYFFVTKHIAFWIWYYYFGYIENIAADSSSKLFDHIGQLILIKIFYWISRRIYRQPKSRTQIHNIFGVYDVAAYMHTFSAYEKDMWSLKIVVSVKQQVIGREGASTTIKIVVP